MLKVVICKEIRDEELDRGATNRGARFFKLSIVNVKLLNQIKRQRKESNIKR